MDNELKIEEKKVLIMHLFFPLIAFIIIFFGLSFLFPSDDSNFQLKTKDIIIDYVKDNSDTIVKFINNEIEQINVSDLKKFNKVDKEGNKVDRKCNDDTCFYEFHVADVGLSISGCYIGFYFTEDDIMHKYVHTDRDIVGDINSYKVMYQGKYLLLEKIKDHFYYYEDCY